MSDLDYIKDKLNERIDELENILAQDLRSIKCKDPNHTDNNGCPRCGGLRSLLMRLNCGECGTEYWDYIRKGSTLYKGKTYDAFDGTIVTYEELDKVKCSHCPKETTK